VEAARSATGGGALLGGLVGGLLGLLASPTVQFGRPGDWAAFLAMIGVVIGVISGFLLWALWVLLLGPLARLLRGASRSHCVPPSVHPPDVAKADNCRPRESLLHSAPARVAS
jgi:hypothetical protein